MYIAGPGDGSDGVGVSGLQGAHDQVYETVRSYGHDSGEIWHRMQKNLPGDLAIQGR